ncbi:MAG: NlpC/P60 family protein [Nitratireductor sp.]
MNPQTGDKLLQHEIVSEARSWIGTPYVHQASAKGAGCDCLGLVAGVWRAIGGIVDLPMPAYTPDWGEIDRFEHVLTGAAERLTQIPANESGPGDLVVFRWRRGMIAKHMGILSDNNRFIHAWERSGVVEAVLVPQWRSRIAGWFRFPEIPFNTHN